MSDPGPAGEEEKRGWREYLKHVGDWFAYKNKGEWLNEMKGGLSMTASIIATMTFQLATNPPGGVVQASLSDDEHCSNRTGVINKCIGDSVMAHVDGVTYRHFLVSNTISFIASLSVCLLLVSGIPLNHRFPIWFLSISMCVAITSLAFTYSIATSMVTPGHLWNDAYDLIFLIGFVVWVSLLGIVVVFLIIRLSVWGVNKRSK